VTRDFIGPLFRREYATGKIRGVVSQIERELFIWWCWRPTGKTISGVHGHWTGAEYQIRKAMTLL
jgi:hypothetical protein